MPTGVRLNFGHPAADKGGVDQVSRPMLIVLAAVVLLAGAWFTVLRPKAENGGSTPAPAAQAPGTTGLSKAVDKAKNAVAQSQASANRVEQAAKTASGDATATANPSTTSAAKSTTTSKAAPRTASAAENIPASDPSGKLLAKLDSGKTVVLLFWNSKGADDRAVRTALHDLAGDKRVATAIAPIADVGDYEAITTGVKVLTAPTVLVIGPDKKAKTISGLTDVAELRQLVGDIRAGR